MVLKFYWVECTGGHFYVGVVEEMCHKYDKDVFRISESYNIRAEPRVLVCRIRYYHIYSSHLYIFYILLKNKRLR